MVRTNLAAVRLLWNPIKKRQSEEAHSPVSWVRAERSGSVPASWLSRKLLTAGGESGGTRAERLFQV